MNWRFPSSCPGEARQFYQEHGFVGLTDLLSIEDLGILRRAFDEAVASNAITLGIEEMVETNDAIFRHPVFEAYAKDKRIVSMVEALFGCECELQHSKLNVKPIADKGRGIIRWHQDYPFFPHTNLDLLAFTIHLDDEEEDSGPVQVIPGSHKWGVLSHCRDGEFAYECTEMIDYESAPQISFTGPANQITIHHCLTLHYSAPKKSDTMRRHLVFQYRAQDAIQLAGVLWRCTGYQVSAPGKIKGTSRFFDGTRVELRGAKGRLYDKYDQLAPDK
jgi:phytanoyl-CoA hydroxylase